MHQFKQTVTHTRRDPARRYCLVVWLICVACGSAQWSDAADWMEFRGPGGRGVAAEGNYPHRWDREQNIRWRTALPRPANSSPIVVGGRVLVTWGTSDGSQRTLGCFDRASGKEMWTRTIEFTGSEQTHQTNPYGGSTPVSDGECVIVWHGSPGVFCYSLDGELQWSRELAPVTHIWGYGSSPVVHGNLVFLNHGPGKEQFLVALDKRDGSVVWRFDEPGGNDDRETRMVGSWSTPAIVEVNGTEQLICSMPARVIALNPNDGQLLWTCGGLPSSRGDLVYTSVVFSDEGLGVAMGGYQGPAIGFRLGGTGDVTESQRLWRVEDKQPQRIGSGVVLGDVVYMANAGPGTFQCIDLKTGEERWVQRMAQNNWGSMVLANGLLYVTNQQGLTRVLKPNEAEFELVAENPLEEPTNATPAFSDDEIFLRTDKALYCISSKNP